MRRTSERPELRRTAALIVALAIALSWSGRAGATINNGENAVDILGEFNSPSVDTTADYVKDCINDGASPIGFSAPGGIAIDSTNHRLFIMDDLNNRVLVFTLTSGNLISSKTAANVIGQSDFISCNDDQGGAESASGLFTDNDPTASGLAFDAVNNRLFVMDANNQRVLVFNTSTITNGMSASYVLGNTDFTGDCTGCTTQATIDPYADFGGGIALDSTNQLLYVADFDNNRVMVFNVAPGSIANGENATYVIGQANFTTVAANGGGSTGQAVLNGPYGVALDPVNHWLYVTDGNNNRVMVFPAYGNAGFSSPGENASYELGQASGGTAFTSNTAATTQSGMNQPLSLAFDSTNNRLFVGDYASSASNNRVLVFNTSSLSNGMNASYVLGASNFTGGAPSSNQADVRPLGMAYDSTNGLLYVSDESGNNDDGPHRVMIFNVAATPPTPSSPIESGQDGCAIANGQLYCWGYNDYGEDGVGNATQYLTPQQVGTATNWTAVSQGDPDSAGDKGACGIAGGALYCWGENAYGELGVGNTTQYDSPQQVGSDTTWTAISVSGLDACGIDNGALYCWGYNNNGEDGTGNQTQYKTPQQVGSATNWTAISTGLYATCGIAGGALYCWGSNSNGELGLGNTTNHTTPQQVGSATNWTVISQGGVDTCGIAGGALYCWGYNGSGELGIGNSTEQKSPVQVGSATNWTAISIQSDRVSGDAEACGIAGGALYCWGKNTYGESGLGNTTAYNTPQQVGALTTWTAVSYGVSDTCGIAGSQLYCWGYNQYGEDGVDTSTENKTPQAVGGVASLGNGADAIDELGQYTSPSSTATVNYNQYGYNNGPTALGFYLPTDVAVDAVNHYFFVADTLNNRVLVYTLNTDNSIPTASGGHTASYVLGQTSLQGGNASAATQSGLKKPQGLAVDSANQRLFVADSSNNRVLVFSYASGFSNGMNASYVLGEANFTNTDDCSGGASVSAKCLYVPFGLAYDSTNSRLFVADYDSNRVLVFNVAPGTIANGESANATSGLLGQTSFSAGTLHHTAAGLDGPTGLTYDPVNQRLFVADYGNNRVTVYNVAPGFSNGESASFELGQPSGANEFTTHGTADTQSGMNNPDMLSYDANNNRLFVPDNGNARVLVYNVGPSVIADGENASYVIGQTVFTTKSQGLSQSALKLDAPLNNDVSCAKYDPGSGRLFVCDTDNNRVMIFEGSAMSTNPQGFWIPGYE